MRTETPRDRRGDEEKYRTRPAAAVRGKGRRSRWSRRARGDRPSEGGGVPWVSYLPSTMKPLLDKDHLWRT